jgi:glycosyltransferase involved in cell wall biosynthesis
MKRPMIHFVVPVYNNESNLEENVRVLYEFLNVHLGDGFELVLSNDGSTDRSADIAGRLARCFPRLRVVGYALNRGRGFAVRFAAETCRGNYLIYADLDFPRTTALSNILDMEEALVRYPIVIGSRFLRESVAERLWKRKVVGLAHRLLVRLFFPKLKIKDPDAGFKGFQVERLKKISPLCHEDRWSWDLEILAIARANGISCLEIPINWNERHERYVTSVHIFKDGWEELTGLIRIGRRLRKGSYRV